MSASSAIKVGLIQINNSFSGQNYLPYSVGILQAYAIRHAKAADRLEFLLPLFKRIRPEEGAERLQGADVALFSVYVWNMNISLAIARQVKERSPSTTIVFGGPHVPNDAEGFLRKHGYIDVACQGEGEGPVTALLDAISANGRNAAYSRNKPWRDIPSLRYLDDGLFIKNPSSERIRDLDTVPSPYLSDVFGPLIAANPDEQWIALWETNRGCPFSCTFCDWGSATAAKVNKWSTNRLFAEIEWFADRRIEFIFCCDANFGILPRDIEIVEYAAKVKGERNYPKALSVQNTKNATERAYLVQKRLSDAGLNKGVDIALQSLDATTLKNIKRDNISLETYLELQRRFTRDRVETYTDMILAMPGETFDSFMNGASTVIEMGQHNRIQFNNLSILPNAEMGDPEYQKTFGMVTVTNEIINIHGSLLRFEGDVVETQEMVIATNSMPKEEWVRTRALSWMISLLHFDKVLQIPIVIVRETTRVRYRELFEHFEKPDPRRFPVLAEIRDFFEATARGIQKGGPEFVYSREWLGICWPADEYILIKLCREEKIGAFYVEAETMLAEFLQSRGVDLPSGVLEESVALNRELLKRPFLGDVWERELRSNIWEFYRGILTGEPAQLREEPSPCRIDRSVQRWNSWDDWCREVIWWGNKKGAYLYANAPYARAEMAGHF